MFLKKPFSLFFRALPLLILIGVSGYYAYNSWKTYQKNIYIKKTLTHIKLLQKYEQLNLKKALCLFNRNQSNLQEECERINNKVKQYRILIQNQNHNLENWIHKLSLKENKVSDNAIERFEYTLGNKTTYSSIHSYFETIDFAKNMSVEKSLFRLEQKIIDIRYALSVEAFLLQYYSDRKIDISGQNIIYWDKLIQSESLSLPDMKVVNSDFAESIKKLLENKNFVSLNNQIDDMHMAVLTNSISKYMKAHGDTLDWLSLLKKKQKVFESIENKVEQKLSYLIDMHIKNTMYQLALFIMLMVLGMIALLLLFRDLKKEIVDDEALSLVVNKLNALSVYNTQESKVLNKMLMKAKNKEEIYTHIYTRFRMLNDKYQETKREMESKSEFLSTLSHEIRTPLNGIIGFSRLLKDMGTTEDQKEFLNLIEDSSHNLITIVNDVLHLSKMNASKMEIENGSFNIFEMVETTISPFVYMTDQKDIEFGVFVDPFISPHFLGDVTKISQVLTNLVSNAIKFTDNYGKINIFIQSLQDSKDEAKIKFSVNDNGIGLSEEQIKNIFKAFSQANRYTSKKYGGTGLGLAISSNMVELMGGKLEVKSEIGLGSSFFFTLILKKDKTKEVPAYPSFTDKIVGIALPVKNIKRQLDTNLEVYIRHLGAECRYYYYDDIFDESSIVTLPDLMIFDHHYARLSGELEQCASIDCKTVILTNSTLRSRINPDKHHFDDIILLPVSLHKTIRILDTIENDKREKQTQVKILNENESFHNLHILVVDDNMINRKLLKLILEKMGLRVTLSANGKEALEHYKKDDFELILMDIQMPIMDGIEATHAILKYELDKRKRHTPIIAITANIEKEDKKRYLSEGMDDYMTKPVEIDVLKKMIIKHCTDISENTLGVVS
jgi:signal transduction histidine kinase/CheY-like chemotaxis protein